jgi:hypothetical protein
MIVLVFNTDNGPVTVNGFNSMEAAQDFVFAIDTEKFNFNNVQFCPEDDEPTHEELVEAGLAPTEAEMEADYQKQILDCMTPDD